jgi:3-oxoacyl-(acyl-carrier-protein) synthase/NAD(P)-dependent dehydrogenase (short-subunit alcohol dehydrogenase family)
MTDTHDHGALMRRALQEIKTLRSALAAAKAETREPVAIVGMGCRFPGAENPQRFWELLKDGVDAITEVPRARWDVDEHYDPDPDAPGKMYTRHGGFVAGIDRFDAQFFGIPPLDALNLDPQQRLLLEVSWEALEHAGQVAGAVPRTGVYVGLFLDDYLQSNFHASDPRDIDAYNTLGLLRSLAAGRLAYVLDLHGPAMQVDTACSSSLLAVHLAVQALRNRECDLALAGGANLTLSPEVTVGLCRMKAMAADGRCKTFDARADGYVRGEGCGMVVLKRLSEAVKDGDAIYAVIRGSAVNHDGRSNGLTAPNGTAQKMLIHDALADGGVEPLQLQFVEAHGTGTSLGDPIEAIALGEMLCQDRVEPLYVGSVKSNIGHLESAAGVAALMKTALALHHGAIPPSLHFETPNPHIPWERLPLTVPVTLTEWPAGEFRMAGVSSFGMSGTNVHMILEQAPRRTPEVSHGFHVLTLSAATPEALGALAREYEGFLQSGISLRDVCHTSNIGRRHFEERLAIVGDSAASVAAQLKARSIRPRNAKRPRPDATLTGMAAQLLDGEAAMPPDVDADRPQQWLESLAMLYELGVDIDWNAVQRGGSKVALPTYPFQRQRFWISRQRHAPRQAPSAGPLGRRLDLPPSRETHFEQPLSAVFPAYLRDHRLDDRIVVPAATYLSMAIESATVPVALKDVSFVQPLSFSGDETRTLHLVVSDDFRFASRQDDDSWITHCEGRFEHGVVSAAVRLDELQARHQRVKTGSVDAGFTIGPSFRWTRGVFENGQEVLCRMESPLPPETAGEYRLHPGLIDSCLRALALCAPEDGTYLPFRIGTLRFHAKPDARATLWCHAELSALSAQHLAGNVQLLDDTGAVILEVLGLEARKRTNSLLQLDWIALPPNDVVLPDTIAPEVTDVVFFCEGEDSGPRLLELLHELDRTGAAARLCLVTRGTQAVFPSDEVDPTYAWVWGLGRVMAMEYPRWRCLRVDLEHGSSGDSRELIRQCISGTEDQIAIRGGVAYVPRLVRAAVPLREAPSLRDDCSYVITGAFGALGQEVARWMVDRGARHLILVGRTPRPLQPLNANIHIIQADVADPADVARIFAMDTPPIRGIIHAAGTLDDALLRDLTWERFESVMAPKVRGTWNLHEQSLGLELDFFICFSSAASLIGSKGQGNYAAANSVMDAVIHHRRRLGLPGLSINWGGWDGAGMAAAAGERMRAIGLQMLAPKTALDLLGRLMQTDLAQAGVIDANWPLLLSHLFEEPPRMFANLLPAASVEHERLIPMLQRLPRATRRTHLDHHVREVLIAVMGKDPFLVAGTEPSFFEIGMDSLTSLDFRNQLQTDLDRTLPATVAFEYPTVPELVEHLIAEVLPGEMFA